MCAEYGGLLPEPRSHRENQVLSQLTTSMFPLGIQKKRGVWQWDSDGTEVNYTDWSRDSQGAGSCVAMNMTHELMVQQGAPPRSNPGLWHKYPCFSSDELNKNDKQLVCERNSGNMYL